VQLGTPQYLGEALVTEGVLDLPVRVPCLHRCGHRRGQGAGCVHDRQREVATLLTQSEQEGGKQVILDDMSHERRDPPVLWRRRPPYTCIRRHDDRLVTEELEHGAPVMHSLRVVLDDEHLRSSHQATLAFPAPCRTRKQSKLAFGPLFLVVQVDHRKMDSWCLFHLMHLT
jgi:hypothetical protein